MTGFGGHGPLSKSAGHDINYIALSGALHAIGGRDKPVVPLNLVGDYGGGRLYLAFGVMSAIYEAQRSGRGQVVDVGIVDGATSLMTEIYGFQRAGYELCSMSACLSLSIYYYLPAFSDTSLTIISSHPQSIDTCLLLIFLQVRPKQR